MALLVFEGFDHHQASAPLGALGAKTGWAVSTGFSTTIAGLLGGLAVGPNTFTAEMTYTPGGNKTTLIAGMRFRTAGTPTGTFELIRFMDGASVQCGLSITTANKLIFWRGTSATVLSTSTTTLTNTSWYFIELKITFHNTTGAYELKLGGVSEFSASGVDTCNTANNFATACTLQLHPSYGQFYDDFYLCDDTGSAPHNDFLGVIRVETAYPTSADATTWTPNASTNVSRVQESGWDGDTSYNSTSTSGNVDTFNHGNLSSTPATIFGVAVTAGMRKDDVTGRTGRTKLKSGGTTQDGASVVLDTSYKLLRDQYVTDPNTGSAWTGANVNATKIGYELV